ncbi:MAG: NAD(P)/FAD-dependent oxidoreductase [Xanthobacteraceae bacterium]
MNLAPALKADRREPPHDGPVPRVVIVGAGFGGMEAARALARSPVEVIIIDEKNHHCFQPLLYQVATAALSPADIAWPIRSMLRRQDNARVMLARVIAVDQADRIVRTVSLPVPYDYLVLATGATHYYFGHDEWAKFAPGLKHIEDARRIRRRILLAFERAELAESEDERRRLMTFAIVGGGPTGVEMAGAIAEVARHALRSDFRRIDPKTSRIVLLEAGPRLLPSFPERLARYAQSTLEQMGVEVLTSARVTGCDENGVQLGNERIEACTSIWAAGVIASSAASWVDAERDRNGRVKVLPNLSIDGAPDIFAIGDTALVLDKDEHPVPGIAPAAKQMGQYVGRLIDARVRGKPEPPPFAYRHYGELATIGRKAAVVKLGRICLTGFVGWLFWSVAHIYFLIGVRNRFVVAFTWLWSYLTLQRGARLIT